MKTYKMRVALMFTEAVLGTLPNSETIAREFLEMDETETKFLPSETDDNVDRGTTVFPKTEDGTPFFFDYQLKGYFKEKCSFLRSVDGKDDESSAGGSNLSSKFTAFKKKIDGLFFIEDRINPIILAPGTEIGYCERPLRAETAKGPRVSLARSEEIPAGATCVFTVVVFNKKHIDLVKEWLEFGIQHGTGQWRNSGKGRFVCEFGDVVESEMDYGEYVERAKRALADNGIEYTLKQLVAAQPETADEVGVTAPKRGRKKAE